MMKCSGRRWFAAPSLRFAFCRPSVLPWASFRASILRMPAPRGVPAAADDLHRAALLRGAHRLHRVQGEPRVQGPPPRARVVPGRALADRARHHARGRARAHLPREGRQPRSATRAIRPIRAPTRSTCASCRRAGSPARCCRRTLRLRLETLLWQVRRGALEYTRRGVIARARRRAGVQHGADAAVREPGRPAQRVRHLPPRSSRPRASSRSTSTSTTRRSRRRRSSPSTGARSRSFAACSPRARTTWTRT